MSELKEIYLVVYNEDVNASRNLRGCYLNKNDAWKEVERYNGKQHGDVYIITFFLEDDGDGMIHYEIEHVAGHCYFECPKCENVDERYGIFKKVDNTDGRCSKCDYLYLWTFSESIEEKPDWCCSEEENPRCDGSCGDCIDNVKNRSDEEDEK